jgi:mannose-1-phosphate guanylyltransferase/mannose-6-phosphate isomerase
MFLFRASRYLEELGRHRPEILQACREAVVAARRDTDFLRLEPEAFAACPSDSIDYAVMEKTDAARVLPIDVGWNDVGSWAAMWEVGTRDAEGNVCHGDVLALDCHDSYAWSERRLVAMIGLENVVVVDTDDAVLVAHKDRVQQVKDVVARLKTESRGEAVMHRKVYRPWGCYDSIDMAERFQVKRITVRPGGTLSLQMHHHRAEHWVVVSGTARVTRGEETFMLAENESTFIPVGTKHRLENPGRLPLELIEVQSGSYLGEDDIVRFEDVYGRSTPSG